MSKRKLFLSLASAGGYIGLGMLLGYVFSDRTTNTSLWVGILLVLLGAVLLGMYISSKPVQGSSADRTMSEPDASDKRSKR
jgi:drug/metabolite transporter (DMT)-like permease